MRFCFLIYSYFPFGGQQRDFMRLLRESMSRDHKVQVYAFRWQGEVPEGVELIRVPIKGMSRLARYRNFTRFVEADLAGRDVQIVVGFNKMPLLDIYFAADPCFAEKAESQRAAYYKYTPRFRHFRKYEEAVFGTGSNTVAFILTDLQRQAYVKHYPACTDRLVELPPGISADRKVTCRDARVRAELRAEFDIDQEEYLILQVGSGFKVKGVDRSLRALASLPWRLKKRCRYLLVGQDRAARFRWLAQRLGVADRVSIIAGREDIPRFFAGADLLLHPAYEESAGYVLLEAAIAGLPVLTTATCGYTPHIERAGAGEVCGEPFSQQELDTRLAGMLDKLTDAPWSDNGLAYGQREELYSMPKVAIDTIEDFVRNRSNRGAIT